MHQKTKDNIAIAAVLAFRTFVGACKGAIISMMLSVVYMFFFFGFADFFTDVSRALFDKDGWYLMEIGMSTIFVAGTIVGAILGMTGKLRG